MLEATLLSYLEAKGEDDLVDWVRARVTFPCSMVDRITPRSTPALVNEANSLFGGRSTSPIHSEDYIQWVLEDSFAGPMPDLAVAGVELVEDVDPYEEAKIRILNGGHTGLSLIHI